MPLCPHCNRPVCPACNRHHYNTWRLEWKIKTPFRTFQGVRGNDLPISDDYVLVESDLPSISQGGTALHESALLGNKDAVRVILRRLAHQGRQAEPLLAQLCAQDFDGSTPLHLAVRSGCSSVVEQLLKYVHLVRNYADRREHGFERITEVKDNLGLTPLHLAVRLAEFRDKSDVDIVKTDKKMKAIIGLLLSQGAGIRTETFGGRSLLSDASCLEDDGLRTRLQVLALCDEESAHGREEKENILPSPDWNSLRAFMSATFWDHSHVTLRSQALAYSNVWNMVTDNKKRAIDSPRLYENVEKYIADEVREIAAAAARLPLDPDSDCGSAHCSGLDLRGGQHTSRQHFYFNMLQKFQVAARHRDHAMRFLNRHWIRREQYEAEEFQQRLERLDQGIDEWTPDAVETERRKLQSRSPKEVYPIEELHQVIWKKYLIEADQDLKSWLSNIVSAEPDVKQPTEVEESEWEFVSGGQSDSD